MPAPVPLSAVCQRSVSRSRFGLAVAVAAALVVTLPPASAVAQDRMPPLSPSQLTDHQRGAAEAFKAARGLEVFGPFVPLLRSPEVMTRFRALGDYLRYRSAVPPRLSELLILLTARHWTQQYEWDTHADIGLKAGLRDEVVNAIADGRRPMSMADDEAAIYDLAIELQRNQSVSDTTYERALKLFGEQGIIDSVGIIGYYTGLAMFMNTTQTPLPPGRPHGLRSFPR